MRSGWLAAPLMIASAGCSLFLGDGDSAGQDASAGDGAVDRDGPVDCVAINTRIFEACVTPTGLNLGPGNYTLDTDTGVLASDAGSTTVGEIVEVGMRTFLAIASREPMSLDQGVTLRARGVSPLILAAPEVSVAGVLHLGGRGAEGGAGSDPNLCASRGGVRGEDGAPPEGGSGGGYSGTGGASDGVAGGAPVALNALAFEGGCPGGNGAVVTIGPGRPGGSGGGAVLIRAVSIVISGQINAGGGGGAAGDVTRGGAGGGSGGLIYLKAESFSITGSLAANGGGGGGAGADNAMPGGDGAVSDSGGTAGTSGANPGGVGGAASRDGGTAILSSGADARGGGGGSAGFIVLETEGSPALDPQLISPPVQTLGP